jgi:NADH dehydrogenase
VIRGRVEDVNFERRLVHLAAEAHPSTGEVSIPAREEPFDQLVLALGSVSNYLGLTNVQTCAFDFKTLIDAIRIRNHVIEVFERADREPDPDARQALTTIVVAGGGFAGVELVGALNDFTRGMLVYYPNIPPEDLQIVLVHSRDRILPELSEALARYALERLAARGVTFKLNARVADARPGVVVLSPPEEIRAETLIWTAGVTPNPLLTKLDLERDRRGAVVVDTNLAVPGRPGVWALGDCAAVTDAKTGQPCPPTAQFAIREASRLARNIHASVHGTPLRPFHFDALGTLCVVGHHTACAEIKGLRFSGFFAWLMWRAIYLEKLPSLERKVRVVADWSLALFFRREVVSLGQLQQPRREFQQVAQLPADHQPARTP